MLRGSPSGAKAHEVLPRIIGEVREACHVTGIPRLLGLRFRV